MEQDLTELDKVVIETFRTQFFDSFHCSCSFNPFRPGVYFERLKKLRFPKNLIVKNFFTVVGSANTFNLKDL